MTTNYPVPGEKLPLSDIMLERGEELLQNYEPINNFRRHLNLFYTIPSEQNRQYIGNYYLAQLTKVNF